MNYVIRQLGVTDAEAYRRVRLDALRLHPEAFGASYEDEARLDMAQIAERLAVPELVRFGGFAQAELVGLAGVQLPNGAKERHKAHLFSMYVDAAHRGGGLARRLVETVIDRARDRGALLLDLTVTVGNSSAQRLYRRMGFMVYGTERRGLKVGDRFYDQELMVLDLD